MTLPAIAIAMQRTGGPARFAPVAVALLGVALIALGLSVTWHLAAAGGQDFIPVYVLGTGLIHGFNVYSAADLTAVYTTIHATDPTGAPRDVLYTPSSGLLLLPLALVPLGVAQGLFFCLSCTLMLVGCNELMRVTAPRVNAPWRLLVLGGLMCASACRWAFQYLQAAPLAFGLLCLYVAFLHRKRTDSVLLAIAASAICLKFTFGLPFIALAILQRRYRVVAWIMIVWLVANAIGFARVGGLEAVQGYLLNTSRFEIADPVNNPDFRDPHSMMRLDWPYLLDAASPDFPWSNAIGLSLSAVCVGWLGWRARQYRPTASHVTTTAVFFGPVVCLSLLSVYHHHYDAVVLLGPAILYALVYVGRPGKLDLRWVIMYALPAVGFAGLYGIEQGQGLLARLLGAQPPASEAWKLIGVGGVVLALFASLLQLEASTRRLARETRAESKRRLLQDRSPALLAPLD